MRVPVMKILAGLLAVALMLPAAGQYSNRRAPGFSLADSKFQQHDPQDYRGKVLLVDIMLTTCPTCTQLADNLVQIKKKYGDKIAIISVVTLPDRFADADAFAAQHGITWPIVFDSGQMIASYLEVTPSHPQVHFPHLFVIDGNGMIRDDYEATDDKSLTIDGLSAAIDRLLAAPKK
jgi:peroxiredoxin